MAKFGDQHAFMLSGIKKHYRVPLAYGNELMYVNVGSNSVIKVHDLKLIHTWTVTHPFSFTAPVAYDSDDGLLYSVLNDQTLVSWSPSKETLKKAVKIKFQESVFSVLPIPGEKPLVLFKSCKVTQLNDSSENSDLFTLKALDPEEKLIWADASVQNSSVQIFCLEYSKKCKKYKLHSFKLNNDKKSVSVYFEQDILNESSTLKDWCLNKLGSIFLTAWSDGSILKHETFKNSKHMLFSTPGIQNNSLIVVDVIDESHIAVAKSVLKQKECCLEIWDFKFSACKVKRDMKVASLSNIQMEVINSSIYLLFNEDLVCVPFHIEKSTLASVMGKSIDHSSNSLEGSWSSKGELILLSKETDNCIESMEIPEYESSKSSSNDSIETIAKRLIDEGSTVFKYIPEVELVSLLRLAIRHKGKNSSKEESTSADIVLNVVLSSSFSDVFVMKHLKKLNLDETLVMLEILLRLLNHEVSSLSEVCEKPSDLQIINWTCLIIQSHMETLLFSKDRNTSKLLRKLEKCLTEKMEEYEDFESIKNFLTLKKDSLPKDNIIRKYCIESLE